MSSRRDRPARDAMVTGAVWHRRVIPRADFAGVLVFAIPMLLAGYLVTGAAIVEYGMYGLCVVAVLPHVGPFLGSLRTNLTNLLFVLLFGVLAIATAAAVLRDPSSDTMLQGKALAATAAWASIYVVVFSSLPTSAGIARLAKWIDAACMVMAASVYVSALGHMFGLRLGEVIESSDGAIRAFGPFGDAGSFVLVLPVLTSLVAGRPLMVGFYLGALLLTGTRGAALSLLIGALALAFLLVSRGGRPRLRLRSIAASAGVAAVVWATPMSTVLMERAREAPDEGAYSMRLIAIEEGIRVARDYPLLGVGFNRFGLVRQARSEDWLTPTRAAKGLARTANQYVQTATDGGVAALAILLLFVVFCGANAFRAASWADATPSLIGSQVWLIGVLAGNQGALWLLGSTASGFFMFAAAGLGAAASELIRREKAAARARAMALAS